MASTLRFSSGPTFTFLAVLSSEGIPLNSARLIEEVLEAAGVNGRRWRTVHHQYPTLTVQTLAEAASFSAAETLARAYLAARLAHQIATLSIDAGGATFTLPRMHVGDLLPIPGAGQVTGPSAGAASMAHVRCAWSLELTGA
ncbi:hypothetical protein [Methylibium sp.]|uniref:hypothetical protein n=1 Tax=Methylibium sp. TaxID=2067992 RepID=UPI001845A972|nr:hypothetical protein [Methylibium sp.]MBA3588515.1 hypothetical protein [Methylibium sp.]